MPELKKLKTAKQVAIVLGWVPGVCFVTDTTSPKLVYHWIGKAKAFPAMYHEVMIKTLNTLGYDAPPELWGQKAVRVITKADIKRISAAQDKKKIEVELRKAEKRVEALKRKVQATDLS